MDCKGQFDRLNAEKQKKHEGNKVYNIKHVKLAGAFPSSVNNKELTNYEDSD